MDTPRWAQGPHLPAPALTSSWPSRPSQGEGKGRPRCPLWGGSSRLEGEQRAWAPAAPSQDSTYPRWEQPEGLAGPVLAPSACPRLRRVAAGPCSGEEEVAGCCDLKAEPPEPGQPEPQGEDPSLSKHSCEHPPDPRAPRGGRSQLPGPQRFPGGGKGSVRHSQSSMQFPEFSRGIGEEAGEGTGRGGWGGTGVGQASFFFFFL